MYKINFTFELEWRNITVKKSFHLPYIPRIGEQISINFFKDTEIDQFVEFWDEYTIIPIVRNVEYVKGEIEYEVNISIDCEEP